MNNISPECSCSYYDIDNTKRAIYGIQTMLSEIARYDERIPPVYPDGFYNEMTADAVRCFCRTRGLEERQTVNEEVFYAIAGEYRKINTVNGSVEYADVFPFDLKNGNFVKGDNTSSIYIIQCMLAEMGDICHEYAEVEINGRYDNKTEKALSRLRIAYGVGKNDTIDTDTWNALAREYNDRKLKEIE